MSDRGSGESNREMTSRMEIDAATDIGTNVNGRVVINTEDESFRLL
jgi:hypothetical protein